MKTVGLLCDGFFILIFSVFFYAFICKCKILRLYLYCTIEGNTSQLLINKIFTMNTFELKNFNTNLKLNTTSIDITLETFENDEKGFLVDANIFDTEGHDEETYLMMSAREVLDLTIPQLIEKAVSKTPSLNIECVIDYTRDSISYYYKVNENDLNDAIMKYLALEASTEDLETIQEMITD